MATSFSSLPIVDLSLLRDLSPSPRALEGLSKQLNHAFATTGFAYLTNAPLSFSHDQIFELASDYFRMDMGQKMQTAKKSFLNSNRNTYRGYFPCHPTQMDNLKEGFEVGTAHSSEPTESGILQEFVLSEPNVWPTEQAFPNGRSRVERLHSELQNLSSVLLSLLAMSLGRPADLFSPYLVDPLSTLRLLHYPPQTYSSLSNTEAKLCCTPHTDSGILTLLHQDPTGGLEVLNASGDWVPAPYVPNSIVVNIGDLLAKVSGGRFIATMHRVRTSDGRGSRVDGLGRLSVPFFFEPGEDCVVRSIDGGESVLYGKYVRQKMGNWVEYRDASDVNVRGVASQLVPLKAR